jgi:hypothetical protein
MPSQPILAEVGSSFTSPPNIFPPPQGEGKGCGWGINATPVVSVELLQTDAPINQGNTGGPLTSLETGNIVGINTAGIRGAREIGTDALMVHPARAAGRGSGRSPPAGARQPKTVIG